MSSIQFTNSSINKYLSCLIQHTAAQIQRGSFFTIIHSANSDYLRFLHDLIVLLLTRKHRVIVFDYRRRLKSVYLQQAIQRLGVYSKRVFQRFIHRIILDEHHALNEISRLHSKTPSERRPPVLILIDPSGLFGRQIGSVKQAASALTFQYEAAQMFAQHGYAVVIADAGGREFHRTEALVPASLGKISSLVLQFLPGRRIKLN